VFSLLRASLLIPKESKDSIFLKEILTLKQEAFNLKTLPAILYSLGFFDSIKERLRIN